MGKKKETSQVGVSLIRHLGEYLFLLVTKRDYPQKAASCDKKIEDKGLEDILQHARKCPDTTVQKLIKDVDREIERIEEKEKFNY